MEPHPQADLVREARNGRPVYGHFMHDLEIFDFEGRQEA